MDQNIIPMIKSIIGERRSSEIQINIFTKELKPEGEGLSSQIFEALEKRYRRLDRSFGNYAIKFKVINNQKMNDVHLHDRVVFSSFLMIDSGVGFNIFPHQTSNSQLIVESIFDLYTYKRLKNHVRFHKTFKQINTQNKTVFNVYPS